MVDSGPYFIQSVSVINHLQFFWTAPDNFSQDYRPVGHLQNVSPDVFTRVSKVSL